ncbi:DUF4238 domain-containing protein [Mesorhizobium sp. BR1-1-2]|uniref:DUF4238 domain-containing protein n=1 Tax=Mesorhizobium sp. BR1-1-2 TaxID=2876652 RepID=UPI001CCAF38E|nr:DUF4238 domain-containing protein [Mesorhizobium sp. BR1-1-2]MBZ9963169.1 DUF4238 domain-containing protein [Mesorhizobium sp. BR1-1-2]
MKTSKPPADHHFVPQFLLRNFRDENEVLHVYDSRTVHRGVFPETTKKVFFESHLYSKLQKQGEKDPALECAFSAMESAMAGLVKDICDDARKGKRRSLSADERSLVDLFSYMQWKRVPDRINATMHDDTLRAIVDDSILEFEKTYRPLSDAERAESSDPAVWRRVRQNARTNALANISKTVMGEFAKCAFMIVRITNPRCAFVISSNPVFRLGGIDGDTRLGHQNVELWLPVASDIAFVHGPRNSRTSYAEVNDSLRIRKWNAVAASGSKMIASKAKALTASLIGSVATDLPQPTKKQASDG